MFVECAWCGSKLGEKDGRGREGVTSGICDACFEAICDEIPESPAPAWDPPQAGAQGRRKGGATP